MAERSIDQIARILEARPILAENSTIIRRLLLDSRQFSATEGILFFALRGKNHDGHDYIRDLIQKGVRNFVVEELPESQFPECNFLIVPNSLSALQKIARDVRRNTNALIVGITGSNAKTIVKEWSSQILQKKFTVCRSPKSYNSQVGVPLAVWELESHHQLGIFEAGISQPGEMGILEEIIKPQIGIFTNIGSAHDQYFDNHQHKIEEKLKLFRHSDKLVYRKNDDLLSQEIKAFGDNNDIELLSWSLTDDSADLYVSDRTIVGENTELTATFKGSEIIIQVPFTDEASIENTMHCWRLALELGMDSATLSAAISELHAVEMRLEMKTGLNRSVVINDAYNADLESLRLALHFQDHHSGGRPRILIISDMLQTGLDADELRSKMEKIISEFELEQVIGIGQQIFKNGLEINTSLDVYQDTEEFLKSIYRYNFQQKSILLKGARPFKFETIGKWLEEKSHETVLNIYLDRLVNNLNYYRSKLTPDTRIMAMVKAFSYGSGSYEIASFLEFHKVDYLGVAYADEGIELRKAGISLPIMVLNPELKAFEEMVRYRLEPEIYNLNKLSLFEEAVERVGVNDPFPIHIKLETGMNRLGFVSNDLDELIRVLQSSERLKVASVFSHLAASDDPSYSGFTKDQISRFSEMSEKIKNAVDGHILCHIANSGAISNHPEAHFDMVRLGIGLYGVGFSVEDRRQLQLVCELKASVSQIKQIEAGDTVGYGLSYEAQGPTTIAVVSIGYADGFRRNLSNGIGEVFINGRNYPVVGKVCMDMIMVDITGGNVMEGEEVEVFGDHISIYDLARKMDTIPYEVLTGIGQRVKRVYFME